MNLLAIMADLQVLRIRGYAGVSITVSEQLEAGARPSARIEIRGTSRSGRRKHRLVLVVTAAGFAAGETQIFGWILERAAEEFPELPKGASR